MRKTVLITGASSGIGRGYAYEFGKRGYDLVLVARNREKLSHIKNEIEKRHSISIHLIIQDLGEINAAHSLISELKKRDLSIDILINNAGFSTKGTFDSADIIEQHQEMILNMVTLTELSCLFSKEWIGIRNKIIINVASAAAYQSTPYSAVYSATKAYVLSLTEALHIEYQDKGIYYLAVCPGATDTAFFDKVGDYNFSKKRTVDNVVNTTFKAMNKKKMIANDGWLTKVRCQMNRVFPRKLITKIAGKIAGRYWNEA